MLNKFLRTLILALSTAGLLAVAGCATVSPEQLAAVEARANAAANEAKSARQAADGAMQRSSEANTAAERAQSTADSALSCCRENTDKIDRMFKKAMQK
jgi:hypothetical protein